jgi:acetylornithine deacetylase
MKIMSALQELERQWANLRHHPLLPGGFNSIMPGLIVGGPGGGHDGRLNQMAIPGTCPDYCSVEYNLWYLPGETFEQIQAEVETYVSDVCRTDPWLREHPPRFTWKLRNIFLPAAETTPDHPFIQTLAGALTRISISPTVEGFTAGSELAWYAEQGINGTIFGPGRIAQAHSPNEYVEIEQLMHSCTAMALAGAAWCGAPES